MHVNKPLSSSIIIEILDQNPDLETITLPESLYNRTSHTYLDALTQLEIQIQTKSVRGRPPIYDDQLQKQIDDLIKEGMPPKIISKRLKISQKTVYHLKTLPLKRGPESKYTQEQIEEIFILKDNGLKVKDISKKMNIPLRSVYDLIKKNKRD